MIGNSVKRRLIWFQSLKFNNSGLTTSGKRYLIIESDDWGAVRTPNQKTANRISKQNKEFEASHYKNDSLASQDDLELLFELLASKKDTFGNNPMITPNVIVANPDFKKIKESGYTKYHYKTIRETFTDMPKHSRNLEIWREGISKRVFVPQFHGREHLNISRWMKALQNDQDDVRKFLDLGMTYSGKGDYSFMEAFDWTDRSDSEDFKTIIEEGLGIYKELFGSIPKSFIAPCYNWDDSVERVLWVNGVRWIQGIKNQLVPTGTFNEYLKKTHKHGELGLNGLRYSVRNVFFEPALAANKDWVGNAMARISNAFFMNKPAIICSHRINYVGYIDESNRDRNLKLLDELLDEVLKKWPDIEFVSSGDYDRIYGIEN